MAEVMSILHLVEASFAGVGRHVLDLAQHQARSGHDVHVVYSSLRERNQFRHGRLTAVDVTWHNVDIPHRLAAGDLAAHRSIRELAASVKPDVVHGHSTKGGMHCALLRCVPTGGRQPISVFTPNALLSMNPTRSLASRAVISQVERTILRLMTRVIAVSPEEYDYLADMGVESNKLRMVPNGIEPIEPTNGADVRRDLGLGPETKIIGFVGRLNDQKSPLSLIEVFNHLGDRRPDVQLVIVGQGRLFSRLQEAADRSRFKDRIHLVGEQPGTWAMNAFDLFLLPSVYEGFPYVLIEAAHLGIPIVTTRQASARQLEERSTGVLRVEAGNTEAMAATCSELLTRFDARSSLDPVQEFTADRMAFLTTEAYLGSTTSRVRVS